MAHNLNLAGRFLAVFCCGKQWIQQGQPLNGAKPCCWWSSSKGEHITPTPSPTTVRIVGMARTLFVEWIWRRWRCVGSGRPWKRQPGYHEISCVIAGNRTNNWFVNKGWSAKKSWMLSVGWRYEGYLVIITHSGSWGALFELLPVFWIGQWIWLLQPVRCIDGRINWRIGWIGLD